MKLKKCLCGENPKIIKERKCYGHGEYTLVAYVKCDNCRLHTPEFSIDGFYGCTDTEDTAIEYWNKLVSNNEDLKQIIKEAIKEAIEETLEKKNTNISHWSN